MEFVQRSLYLETEIRHHKAFLLVKSAPLLLVNDTEFSHRLELIVAELGRRFSPDGFSSSFRISCDGNRSSSF